MKVSLFFIILFLDDDISNCVLHLMDIASQLQNIDLNEDLIDAGTEFCENITHDDDMLVTLLYIAESFTFGREPNFRKLNIQKFR